MHTIAPDPDAIDERLTAWQYVREFGCGQDHLPFVADQLRLLATPAALRMAQAIAAGNNPHWMETPFTVWFNDPIMASCHPGYELDAAAERLSLDPHTDFDELNAILDAAVERLPGWDS